MVELTKKQSIKRSDFIIAPYLYRSNAKASWQVLITILPIVGLWILIQSISTSELSDFFKIIQIAPSLVLLTLLSSRTFSLMHDCGHGSLFRTRMLNRLVGFFLGWIGEPGKGRALGVNNVKFTGEVLKNVKIARYQVDIKRILKKHRNRCGNRALDFILGAMPSNMTLELLRSTSFL